MKVQEIIDAIENGAMTEKYDEWKNHKTNTVRMALASKGYFPEHFINDETNHVRRIVPRHHPEYYARVLKDPSNDHWCYKAIMNEVFHEPNLTNETIDVATDMIKTQPALFNMGLTSVSIATYCQILERKRTANHHIVNLLESGMSNAQLFAVNNDLWCKSYSVSEIRILDDLRKVENHKVQELEPLFDRDNMTDLSKYREMLRQYRMRRTDERKEKDDN